MGWDFKSIALGPDDERELTRFAEFLRLRRALREAKGRLNPASSDEEREEVARLSDEFRRAVIALGGA